MTDKVFASHLKSYDIDYDDASEAGRLVQFEEHRKAEPGPAMDAVAERLKMDLRCPTSRNLLFYFLARFEETHGFEYKTDWAKEHQIMKAFLSRYGPDAGPMVAVLFDKFGGKWQGSPVTMSVFSRGAKWIQDAMYAEVQKGAKGFRKVAKKQSAGMMSSDDFINRCHTVE